MKEGWRLTDLDQVCLKITDGAHFSPKQDLLGKPMASVKDLSRSGINFHSCKKISESDFRNLVEQGCSPQYGDVLIAKDGNTSLDTVCVYRQSEEVVLLSSVAILRPDPDQITSDFLCYYLDSPVFKNYLKENFRSGSAIPRVILKDFKKVPLTIPKIEVQILIGRILRSLDDKIELNRQMNATLEATAQAIFKEWFVDFRFPGATGEMEESELGPIPKGWRVVELGDIIEVKGGTTPSTGTPEYWGGNLAWATPKDLSNLASPILLRTERQITQLGLAQISSGLLPSGTLLLSSRAPIGYLAIANLPIAINQGFIAIQGRRLSNLFMFFWLKTNMAEVKGRANGSTFQEISKSNFRSIPIIIPEETLPRKFEDITKHFFEQIKCLEIESKNLIEARDQLLPKLISGSLEI